jgi:bifunctional non-homologous end joining protein LigD
MTPISPMLASVGTDVPRGEGWVFEPKYDGIRVLAFVGQGKASLISRNGLDKTKQFPEIADALVALHKKVKRPFVLDGEVVIMQGDSPLRFQELQSRMHVNDRVAIALHREATPAALMVFDVLLDGTDSLVTEPWRVRRKHLAALLRPPGAGSARSAGSSALRLSDVGENGDAMLREARAHDWEGIIAKRADASYEVGRRSSAWLKLKIERRQELVVGGWTEPR